MLHHISCRIAVLTVLADVLCTKDVLFGLQSATSSLVIFRTSVLSSAMLDVHIFLIKKASPCIK